MAAITYRGQVPADDPMFLSGPQLFSRHETNGSTKKKPYNPLTDKLPNSSQAKDIVSLSNSTECQSDEKIED